MAKAIRSFSCLPRVSRVFPGADFLWRRLHRSVFLCFSVFFFVCDCRFLCVALFLDRFVQRYFWTYASFFFIVLGSCLERTRWGVTDSHYVLEQATHFVLLFPPRPKYFFKESPPPPPRNLPGSVVAGVSPRGGRVRRPGHALFHAGRAVRPLAGIRQR